MRAYEKEILEAQVKSEEWVIRQLKLLYNKANDDINEKIKALKIRYEEEGLQSIIYQMDYQKALRTQIKGVLDVLYADEHTKISEYLKICYEEGFIGSMYSLSKQGIPLIMPMDQEQIINALVHKSKLSEGLYKKLGININDLRKRINVEVSRGLANNYSLADIARNIKNASSIDINKSLRIARTEGHRIQGQAQMDACNKSKEKGADIVKQWDAALDSRTRPSHQLVDGEIRELDEKFSNGLMFPGDPSGKAAEVVNCRCALLQRAKWALDEDELETLKERANYYGLDKTENFEDFKKKYLKAVEEEKVIEEKKIVDKKPKKDWNIDEASDEWAKTLTKDEMNEILVYTSGDGMDINDYLRERNYFKDMNKVEDWYKKDLEKRVKLMDDAIDKFDLQQDQVVYRRVKANALQEMTGIRSDEDWYDLMFEKDGLEKLKKKLVGKEYFDKGYGSSALNRNEVFRLYDDTQILFEIDVPKGSKAAYLGKHSAIEDQTELLLARGSKFDITDVRLEKIKWIDDYGDEIESKVFVIKMKDKSIKDVVEEALEEVVDKANPRAKLTLDNFPDAFKANTKKTKNAQLLSDYINGQSNADPRVVELYSKLNDMENITKNNIPFEVKFGQSNAVSTRSTFGGKFVDSSITLQDLTKNNSLGAYQTNLHEAGHLIDLYKRKNISSSGNWFTSTIDDYKDVLTRATSSMSDEVKTLFETTKKKYLDIEKKIRDIYNPQLSNLTDSYKQGKFSTYSDYSKAWKKLIKERNNLMDIEKRNLGIGMLEDIYDALSGGTYRDSGVVKYGHGSKYYRTYESRINEIFANYMSLSVSRPDLVDMLRRDKKELVEMLDKIVDDMLKGGK